MTGIQDVGHVWQLMHQKLPNYGKAVWGRGS